MGCLSVTGLPSVSNYWYPFIHLGGERYCESKVSCPTTKHNVPHQSLNPSGFIKFLCRRTAEFFSQAFFVFLMKESKKRRQKQPGKFMAKFRSQLVNLPGVWPLINQSISQSVNQSTSRLSDTGVSTCTLQRI